MNYSPIYTDLPVSAHVKMGCAAIAAHPYVMCLLIFAKSGYGSVVIQVSLDQKYSASPNESFLLPDFLPDELDEPLLLVLRTTGAVTVTVAVVLVPPDAMVISASPGLTAVMMPLSSTVATFSSEELYSTGSSANSAGSRTGLSCTVPPVYRPYDSSMSLMAVTLGTTDTCTVSVYSFAVMVRSASPIDPAVIAPESDTLNTLSSDELNVIFSSLNQSGSTVYLGVMLSS